MPAAPIALVAAAAAPVAAMAAAASATTGAQCRASAGVLDTEVIARSASTSWAMNFTDLVRVYLEDTPKSVAVAGTGGSAAQHAKA